MSMIKRTAGYAAEYHSDFNGCGERYTHTRIPETVHFSVQDESSGRPIFRMLEPDAAKERVLKILDAPRFD